MKINYLYFLLLPLYAPAQVQTLKGNGQPVMQLHFGQNQKELLVQCGKPFTKTYNSTPTYYAWNLETNQRTELFSEQITQLSPNGQFIARVRANHIEISDRTVQKIIHTIPIESLSGLQLSFTEDSRSLLVQNNQGFSLFDLAQAKFIRHWQRFGDTKFVLSDSFWVQSEGDSMRLQHFNTQKWLKTLHIPHGEQLKKIIFSPELIFFVTHSDQYLRLWETLTPALVPKEFSKTVQINKNDPFLSINPEGSYLLFGKDTLKLYIMPLGKIIIAPIVFEHAITKVTWFENWVAAGDQHGNVKIWKTTDEIISKIVYQKEIETEIGLVSVRNYGNDKESENRRKKIIDKIYEKYLRLYSEIYVTNRTPQDRFLNYLDMERMEKIYLEQKKMERALLDKNK
jgi:WD40 repeat protein